jgi:hypothetical protein
MQGTKGLRRGEAVYKDVGLWLTGALLGVLLASAPAQAQYIVVPGYKPDQDKLVEPDSMNWVWNYYQDLNANGQYDLSEPVQDSLAADANWNRVEDPGEDWGDWSGALDNSCWAATAANMVHYIGAANPYQDWMYTSGCTGRNWTHGGPIDGAQHQGQRLELAALDRRDREAAATAIQMAGFPGSQALYHLSGSASAAVANSVTVGSFGSGELVVHDGALRIDRDLLLGLADGGEGNLIVSGGLLTADDLALFQHGTGSVLQTSGTVEVRNVTHSTDGRGSGSYTIEGGMLKVREWAQLVNLHGGTVEAGLFWYDSADQTSTMLTDLRVNRLVVGAENHLGVKSLRMGSLSVLGAAGDSSIAGNVSVLEEMIVGDEVGLVETSFNGSLTVGGDLTIQLGSGVAMARPGTWADVAGELRVGTDASEASLRLGCPLTAGLLKPGANAVLEDLSVNDQAPLMLHSLDLSQRPQGMAWNSPVSLGLPGRAAVGVTALQGTVAVPALRVGWAGDAAVWQVGASVDVAGSITLGDLGYRSTDAAEIAGLADLTVVYERAFTWAPPRSRSAGSIWERSRPASIPTSRWPACRSAA